MLDLRSAVALVTGASRGIGPHVAEALAREGVHVALVARDGAGLEQVAARMRAAGVRAVSIPADLRRPEERAGLVARAEATLGPIDLLVNGAAVESTGPFPDLDPAVLAATVELNLTAPMQLAQAVLPGMLRRRRGHVVNLASLAGKKGIPYGAVYSATKAGLIEWTGALRSELAGTGVSLSVVCPGFVTGEGMFARSGVPAPALLGSCTPDQVAAAVVRAIRRDLPEVLVNSVPVRPFMALIALSPRAGPWVLRRMGVVALQRRRLAAEAEAAAPERAPGVHMG
jgi:short-subunit dehydrogenase